MPFLHDSLLLPTICLQRPRCSSHAIRPNPALNSFQHPWRGVGGGAISLVGVWGKDYPCRNVLSGQLLDIDFNSTIRHDHKG